MFFVLQKMIWFVLLPPASLLVLLVIGLLLLRERPRAGRRCIWAAVILLYLLSLSQVADMILRPLEGRYPVFESKTAAVEAVVVPGGGSVDLDWMAAPAEPNAETLARLVKGVELAKRFNVPLILCGGNGEPFSTTLRDADVMAAAALRMGFSGPMIVENESRNTLENSHAVRRIFPGKRIVLATSAYYMRRAVALFERRGFTVTPALVFFLAQTRKTNLSSLVPGANSLARSSTGIAEWLGMAWWHLRGEI